MSKPIKLTDELIDSIQREFVENIKKVKMFDGKLNYNKSFKWDGDDKAVVVMSSVAFAKMTMLIQTFSSEVAWHGVAFRDEKVPNRFYITDILVYPQLVTGATVDTDQMEYQNWLYSYEDDIFNNIRMQGHSHVNMRTDPSGVDTGHQEKILSQIDDDMFYIFMIWNKKFEKNIKVFDMKNNTLYETADVNLYIGEDGCDLDAFIKNANAMVKPKPTTTQGYNYSGNQSKTPAQTTGAKTVANETKTTKEVPSIGTPSQKYSVGRGYDDDDDYGYGYGYCGYSGYRY